MFAYRMSDPDPEESGPPCPLCKALGIILAILLLLGSLIPIIISGFIEPGNAGCKRPVSQQQQVIATRCPYCHKEFTISERR